MIKSTKEYSEALFILASQENVCKEVSESLKTMSVVFEENEDYDRLLSSPAISQTERLSLIDQAFSGMHEYAVSLLKLLCEKESVDLFGECVEGYEELLSSSNRVSHALVTSAVELTDSERSSLMTKLEKLSGAKVILEEKIDPSVLGGIVIDIDGRLIDASVKSRLGDVKEVMTK